MRVTDVLLNFRHALLAVVPAVEKVNIPWRRPDAYDEWDAIASVLFESLVVEVLRWSLPDSLHGQFRLPKYDLLRSTYVESCVLQVTHSTLPDGIHIFHAFGTAETPFDLVEVRRISEKGEPYGQDLDVCSASGATFSLRLDPAFDGPDLIDEITIADQ